jgi:hypothetical protein
VIAIARFALAGLTVTVNVPLRVFPDASWARQITMVTPMGNVLPDAGTQLTVGATSTESVAVAAG